MNFRELKKYNPEIYNRINRLSEINKEVVSGFGNRELIEPLPIHNEADNEKIMSGNNNTFIIMGRDRPSGLLSGYGGAGKTKSGMIDITVGKMGYNPRSKNEEGTSVYAEPNFTTDASRVYISQRSDIDDYLGIVNGNVGRSKEDSSIALKSDQIRIVARKGIKLVTGSDIRDSDGNKINRTYGIDIIAGNDDSDLQPLAKGDNLKDALVDIVGRLEEVCMVLEKMNKNSKNIYRNLVQHHHYSPFFGKQTSPSDKMVFSGTAGVGKCVFIDAELNLLRTNLRILKNNYLKEGSAKYINSYYNNTN